MKRMQGTASAAVLAELSAPGEGRWQATGPVAYPNKRNRRSGSRLRHFENGFDRLARRQLLAMLLVGLLPLVLRAVLLPAFPIPQPAAHDEFSYLLAGDTFSHGRVTNPTPPFWQHFESEHILVRPTYMSMYQPAQGLMLALGELMGRSWLGVWLSVGLMCGVLCWMLQSWLPPRWALLGGIFAALNLGIFSYWMNSYWGGALPALGGALALGALPRIMRRQKIRHALLLAFGIALLANTRAFEGLVFSLTVAALLLVWLCGSRRPPLARLMSHFVLPVAAVLGLVFVAMGYYYWRVTGSPWQTPYMLNRHMYAIAPLFIWQKLASRHPLYHNLMMRNFFLIWEPFYFLQHTRHLARFTGQKAALYWRFFVGPLFTIPLLMLPWVVRDRRIRPLLAVLAVGAAALFVEAWAEPHYAAPFTAAIYVLIMQGMRHLWVWRRQGRRLGRQFCLMLVAACLLVTAIQTGAAAAGKQLQKFPQGENRERAIVARQLLSISGKHLVMVQYEPTHDPTQEWVYNSADLSSAKVIWARALDPESDAALARFFSHRQVWTVNVDAPAPRLVPWQPGVPAISPSAGPTR